MNIRTLKSLVRIKGLRQADVALLAGVSRQAVHKWWIAKESHINVFAENQRRLASSLGVSMEVLSKELPIVSSDSERRKLESQLLWDKLYPDIESFIRALVLGQLHALARLVQVFGLFESEIIIGKAIWVKFPEFKAKIHPGRRQTLEIVWNEVQSQTSF